MWLGAADTDELCMSPRLQSPSSPPCTDSLASKRQAVVLRMAELAVQSDRIAAELVGLQSRLRTLEAQVRDA